MIGFLLISFVAGILTVLAPCVLPLLPVIVGRSMAEETSKRRLFVVSASLGASVFLFTLVLKASTVFISIPLAFWQSLSGVLLIIFGLSMIWPAIWDNIPGVQALYIKSNKLVGSGYTKQSIWGDVLIGAALGPVFSSCSPTYFVILAAVLPAHFGTGVLYLLAYTLGMCLFLFVIALLGQAAATKLGVVADSRGKARKIIGILFIIIGIAVVFGLDKRIEAVFPQGAFGEIGLEQKLLGQKENKTNSAPVQASSTNTYLTLDQKSARYPLAPELVQPDGFINTDGKPVSLGDYKGKAVVLLDFWDYSCINCQRTFPYLKAWYEKYKDQGLVIVGVHTPEFAFDHSLVNVDKAAKQFGLTYPIVLDNEYRTWNAFLNQYWPREYLIDIDGFVVHDHAGEGEYDVTEKAIQKALAERASRLGSSSVTTAIVDVKPADLSGIYSPETYFGAARNEYLANGNTGTQGVQNLTIPASLEVNKLYLGGTWNFNQEFAEAGPGATIEFKYGSHDVYFVATNPKAPVRIKVFRDGMPVGSFAGSDVDSTTSEATINGDRLYKLIHDARVDVHTIRIEVESGTLDAYTFTFG